MHDFRFTTPSFVFHNKTWGFQDLADELKSQMLKAAWSQVRLLLAPDRMCPLADLASLKPRCLTFLQKGSLVSQLFTKTGRKATAALGYQQNSGSNTSVASSASSSSTRLAVRLAPGLSTARPAPCPDHACLSQQDPSQSWTPSSSAPDNLHTFGAGNQQPSSTSPTSSRKGESLLRRTLHLSVRTASCSASNRAAYAHHPLTSCTS
jgi:hypothetical protein